MSGRRGGVIHGFVWYCPSCAELVFTPAHVLVPDGPITSDLWSAIQARCWLSISHPRCSTPGCECPRCVPARVP